MGEGLCPRRVSVQRGGSLSGEGVSVWGGGLCLGRGVSVQGVFVGSLSRASLSRGTSVQQVSVQEGLRGSLGISVQEGLCPGEVSVRETPHMAMCRQYTSYWNAFLFFLFLFKIKRFSPH